VLWSHRCQE